MRKRLSPGLVRSLEAKCRVRGASMDACTSIRHTSGSQNIPNFGHLGSAVSHSAAAHVEAEAAQRGSKYGSVMEGLSASYNCPLLRRKRLPSAVALPQDHVHRKLCFEGPWSYHSKRSSFSPVVA